MVEKGGSEIDEVKGVALNLTRSPEKHRFWERADPVRSGAGHAGGADQAGVVLEMGCGRILNATSYLVTGLGAVALFWLIYSDSLTPLVGASGAIAGLMGALTVLYGRKKIKMFIYLGFYFHYMRVPAIWLLPPWMGK